MDTILFNVSKVSSWTPQQYCDLLAVQPTLDNILLLPFNDIVEHFDFHCSELFIAIKLPLHQVYCNKIIDLIL